MILKRLIYVLVCMSLIGCSINNSIADNRRVYEVDEIPDNAVALFNMKLGCVYTVDEIPNNSVESLYENFFPPFFVIRFSNLIYGALVKGEVKKIKIPIFQGTLDDVGYSNFLRYCRKKNMLKSDWAESGFVILTKRGETKKTLLEFIKFYEGNILKGYEKPVDMVIEGGQYFSWYIEYKFKIENIPCRMLIIVPADERDRSTPNESFKSVEDIHINENMERSCFMYQFFINER